MLDYGTVMRELHPDIPFEGTGMTYESLVALDKTKPIPPKAQLDKEAAALTKEYVNRGRAFSVASQVSQAFQQRTITHTDGNTYTLSFEMYEVLNLKAQRGLTADVLAHNGVRVTFTAVQLKALLDAFVQAWMQDYDNVVAGA